ncbi:RdgB/HAM1 family non-canonical purine NTP pyrophosphatase [Legionella sp. km772]|uniref:RdgB/HAM1 family non-canonical purine NTP pyrophosphatase n=1 Tax=Legionella sp. km772 TaxID=2498111 RepID=UPI000F8C8D23|nr:RdgB/HAM1 family non-canonical purine NTP pyrophosphatase [Legionella sp. km772]RUR07212.1 RdgB/HAM1 family non-canonical purine NTP pyrophosphatase [Legionella sp. km772]
MKELILATSNKGKIKELRALLAPSLCTPQQELGISDAHETGLSFIENALIKARHASHFANKPALADDSGLVVPALNGAPGIYSARYAGEPTSDSKNINLLLSHMKSLPKEQRQAYFYCAIALVQHSQDPTPIIATGIMQGVIINERRGDQGFGYDPIFFIEQYQCTAAELSASIKNRISHRALALNQLKQLIPVYE